MGNTWNTVLMIACFIASTFLCDNSAMAEETVMLGINVPLSGAYSRQGEDQLKAYKLAVHSINEKGGILGRKVVYSVKDMINCLKNVTQLKLRNKMSIVVPLMELHMADPLGPELMQGIITSMCWYHGLSEKYEGSKVFVEAFEKEYGKKPGNSAATAWVDIHQYADAVGRAGTFDRVKVIKALEGHRFKLLGDEEYWRSWDHQGIHPTYVAVGKTPAESRDRWDLFKIISEQKGEDVARTREENPVTLEPLE